ncbi:DUF885 domain-containing protein [Cryptosporangium aurantiacum]|uniref:Uncharacterized conserved protein, DUF885 familyt n=1 Tax=Cryptosporangium aurantiacum TaxID=134849 RepID=A0A1M7RJJ9_9ACTN|nr:DUF885 domain-containing protein [Cryptosporangium aurantiacum]SHN46339.1 Uncharacterized conserved protein, DUF885 familyt [Cryptosporangium aurantiacum]
MTREFRKTAEAVVDDLLAGDPVGAMYAGDHRGDHDLPDYSADAVADRIRRLREDADALAEIDVDDLGPEDAVDTQLLASAVDQRLFALTELREHEWNPLLHNPGALLDGLITREFAPPAERLEALADRLRQVPDALRTAETTLHDCPRIHVETAIGQLDGVVGLVSTEVPRLAAQVPGLDVTAPATAALAALDRHRAWLVEQLDTAQGEARLGRRLWEAKLWHELDSELTASTLLAAAEKRLAELGELTRAVAEELTGSDDVRAALDVLAADRPTDRTIVARASADLQTTLDFVREHDLVTLPEDECRVIEMPEFARGVAVAYCDAPGPLETAAVPTFYAIAPTPADWSDERRESFYREYNNHLLLNLTVHEAVPGHFVQLAHARRFRASTRARALCMSGSFVEGWAVHAEHLMSDAGFGGPQVRLQQLKMELRMVINALLDQLVHAEDLSEGDAMALMVEKGFQEEGEAAGKWRRALLTSAQLSTYFVGYTEVSAIAAARPPGVSVRDWHDRMLAHGSPSPRHLRSLLDI